MPALVSDQVFSRLLEDLLAERYAPGEKLPTQRTLAADLGVTMTSLREALKRLARARRARRARAPAAARRRLRRANPRRRLRGARADAARPRRAGRAPAGA